MIILAGALASLTFYEVVRSHEYTPRFEKNVPQRPLKGDRLPAGPACLPDDLTSCVRKQRPAADRLPEAREVRVAILNRSLTMPAAVGLGLH
jgi:hypothetical protein